MWRTILSAIVAGAITSQSPLCELQGVVNVAGEPVAGATVVLAGSSLSKTAISDSLGRYRFIALPTGDYSVTASLAGFRTLTRQLAVSANTTLDLDLTAAPAIEVLYVVPTQADAYVQADAVARLRIERALPPEPCGQIVTSVYEATVLDLVKGTMPTSVELVQETAGTCLDAGREVEGMHQPFQPGEEHVMFLRRVGDRFQSLAGASLTFKVEHGLVDTRGYAELPATMPLEEFYAAVRAMARERR